MPNLINNLSILNDYKKQESLTYSSLNSALIYGSLIGVNLIDAIKDEYSSSSLFIIDSKSMDDEIKKFIRTSLSNYFLNTYANKYGDENNLKGYISKLTVDLSNNCLKLKNNDFTLDFINLDMNKGIKSTYESSSSNLSLGTINLTHTQKLNQNYDAYNVNNPNDSNGYNGSYTLNSYNYDNYGHVIENAPKKVIFPKSNDLIKIYHNSTSQKITTNSYFSISGITYYNTIFLFTFYFKYSSDPRYITVPLSIKSIDDEYYKGLLNIEYDTSGINIKLMAEIYISNNTLYIKRLGENGSSFDLYLYRVVGYTIN